MYKSYQHFLSSVTQIRQCLLRWLGSKGIHFDKLSMSTFTSAMLHAQEDKGTDSAFDRDFIPICQLASSLMSLRGSLVQSLKLRGSPEEPASCLFLRSTPVHSLPKLTPPDGGLERHKTYMEGNCLLLHLFPGSVLLTGQAPLP